VAHRQLALSAEAHATAGATILPARLMPFTLDLGDDERLSDIGLSEG
jgi:hypothetical protein